MTELTDKKTFGPIQMPESLIGAMNMDDCVIDSNTTNREVVEKQTYGVKVKSKGMNSGLLEKFFFVLVFVSLAYGWLIREEEIFTAETGWGYWLGIIGGSLMLILMLYPMRKHAKFMRNMGPIRYWFRFHMAFGVLGPIAVLFHANFSLGSVNSNVALFAMITVATSGLVGRFFYTKIHNGLYGKKASLDELENAIINSAQGFKDNSQISVTEILKCLEKVKMRLINMADQYLLGILILPFLSIYTFIISIRTNRIVHQLLKSRLDEKHLSETEAKEIKRQLKISIKQYLTNTNSVVEYVVYERIFSLWHVLHLPLFIIMLLTGLFHVYAVHMY